MQIVINTMYWELFSIRMPVTKYYDGE